jgi:hypothetical protein
VSENRIESNSYKRKRKKYKFPQFYCWFLSLNNIVLCFAFLLKFSFRFQSSIVFVNCISLLLAKKKYLEVIGIERDAVGGKGFPDFRQFGKLSGTSFSK